tara:strand:- start:1033 stop:1371 length:339 start_codon:yes stop_codon:yes gene_type:complete
MAPAGNGTEAPFNGQGFASTYVLCKVRLPEKIPFSAIDKALVQRTFPLPMSSETPNRSLTPQELDFTHAHIMSRYVTETGKILPRKITRLSAKQQRKINKAIKRARNMLMMQ